MVAQNICIGMSVEWGLGDQKVAKSMNNNNVKVENICLLDFC